MSYDNKNIVRANGAPVPQFYNSNDDEYQVLTGEDGANSVKVKESLGISPIFKLCTGSISPGASNPSSSADQEYNYPMIVDYLEWGATSAGSVKLFMEIKINGVWTCISMMPDIDSSGSYNHTIDHLIDKASGDIEVLAYDTINNNYKVRYRNPIYAPEGFRVYLVNLSGSNTYNGSFLLKGRRFA